MEAIYEQNKAIEEAIAQLEKEHTNENIGNVLKNIHNCMRNGAELLVPVDIPNSEIEKLDGVDVRVGEPIHTDKDLKLQLKAIKDNKNNTWTCAFTSTEELEKGSKTFVISTKMIALFQLALTTKESAGVVLNAFGQSFLLRKEWIALFFNKKKDSENDSVK